MCSIFGAYASAGVPARVSEFDILANFERGRDSWGVQTPTLRSWGLGTALDDYRTLTSDTWIVGNTRAEPTTEWVPDKANADVQPFSAGAFTVAHNGTFANDDELIETYGVEAPSTVDTAKWVAALDASGADSPHDVMDFLTQQTKGSWGIAVGHRSGWLLLASNYRPIWVKQDLRSGVWHFTSIAPRERGITFLAQLQGDSWHMLPPYSALLLNNSGSSWFSLRPETAGDDRTLVVCSGGLDSTVAATYAARKGPTDLLHITYGCRAEQRELQAVKAIADRLGTGLRILDLTQVFAAIGNSKLTGTRAKLAQGQAGAEYASEWVPARNTILLAAAVGIAEGHGYRTLMLGNNLEEAGAYPDNEQEFIGRWRDLLPFAVADGVQLDIQQPVGALTKREIVFLGLELGAPLGLTWSCYEGGDVHCGTCGPCYMRQRAYRMIDQPDPMQYAGR